MDLMGLYLVGIGVLLIVGIVISARVGYMRLRGRRSRWDRLVGTYVSAAAAGVYPPSLRPVVPPDSTPIPTPVGDGLAPDTELPLPSAHRPSRRRHRRSTS